MLCVPSLEEISAVVLWPLPSLQGQIRVVYHLYQTLEYFLTPTQSLSQESVI